MTNGIVLDLAAKRAEKYAQKVDTKGAGSPAEEIVACSVCDNKAFTLIENSSSEASLPGFDVICTACGTTIDMLNEEK